MLRNVLDEVIRKTLTGFRDRLADFGPNLLAMLLILAVGLMSAAVVRLVVKAVLPRLGFDRFAQRVGLAVVLERGGIANRPSNVVALVLAWGVLAAFVLLAIGTLNLQFAMELVSRGFLYLPQLLVAMGVLILGAMVAGFLRRSVLIAAVNAELPYARVLAGAAHTALLVLAVAMALEHLGVGRQVILAAFTIAFGGVVFALALAFGLAGADLAREFLERAGRRQSPADGGTLRHL